MAIDAPKGVLCTKAYFKVKNVSLGYDHSGYWKDILLKDGTSVKFTTYSGCGSI